MKRALLITAIAALLAIAVRVAPRSTPRVPRPDAAAEHRATALAHHVDTPGSNAPFPASRLRVDVGEDGVVLPSTRHDHGGDSTPIAQLRPENESVNFTANNDSYILEVLAPRVRECWGEVEGDGELETRHTFVLRDGYAEAAPLFVDEDASVTIDDSSLPADQDDLALECIQRAAEGTRFPYVSLTPDSEEQTLTLYRSWPTRERIARMRAEGTDS